MNDCDTELRRRPLATENVVRRREPHRQTRSTRAEGGELVIRRPVPDRNIGSSAGFMRAVSWLFLSLSHHRNALQVVSLDVDATYHNTARPPPYPPACLIDTLRAIRRRHCR